MNLRCKVCGEKAAGFHFGAFTCEGCKSFFGRCCNNMSVIGECRNNKECIIDKKNRTSCKACRLQKCLLVGMSKSGSRYGRRSNWFKQYFQENELRSKQQRPAIASPPSASATPNASINSITTTIPTTTVTTTVTTVTTVTATPATGTVTPNYDEKIPRQRPPNGDVDIELLEPAPAEPPLLQFAPSPFSAFSPHYRPATKDAIAAVTAAAAAATAAAAAAAATSAAAASAFVDLPQTPISSHLYLNCFPQRLSVDRLIAYRRKSSKFLGPNAVPLAVLPNDRLHHYWDKLLEAQLRRTDLVTECASDDPLDLSARKRSGAQNSSAHEYGAPKRTTPLDLSVK